MKLLSPEERMATLAPGISLCRYLPIAFASFRLPLLPTPVACNCKTVGEVIASESRAFLV